MRSNPILLTAIAVSLSTIALVPAAGGSLVPDAASDATPPGVWTSDNADWALAPGDEDLAIEIVTQDDGENFGGAVTVNLTEGTQIADLEDLSFDAYYEEGGCGGGSPRASFAIDLDSDGERDGYVFAHAGEPASFDGCPLGEWQTHDLLDGKDRFVTLHIGGSYGVSQSQAHDDAGSDHQILSASIVWDSTWKFGPSTTYLTNICVNDYTLAQPGDEVLSVTEPGCE